MFSFGQAYDHFKKASYNGNTLAAYNVAVMHYLGIGTFKSCQVA
jgi:TPR repeat protein